MHVLKGMLLRTRTNRKKQSIVRSRATAGMRLTFRAELMPGRDTVGRTFTVAGVLASGRVELIGLGGQHTMTEFAGGER